MLVLNATYEPINVCTVRRAVVLLLKEKAEMIERADWQLHSERTDLSRPMVIRLVSYVRIPRDTHRRKITRRAVFARDDWTCQYCGSRSNLTVDHVIPRSKGGSSTGRTSSPPARRATAARATRCCATRACPAQPQPAHAEPERLHPGRQPHDPGGLAGLPGRLTRLGLRLPARCHAAGQIGWRVRDVGGRFTAGEQGVGSERSDPRIVATPLFRDRPRNLQIVLGGVVPVIAGAVAGVLVGASSPRVLGVGPILAAIGAFLSGFEHRDGWGGADRGFFGGVFYGIALLVMHAIVGTHAKVSLGSFPPLLAVVTAIVGMLLAAGIGPHRAHRAGQGRDRVRRSPRRALTVGRSGRRV